MSDQPAPSPKPLRSVAWVNVWNRIGSLHHDTPGRLHLTASAGRAGQTLCGRDFPKDKGYTTAFRYCKRCVQLAYTMGYQPGFTKSLDRVE